MSQPPASPSLFCISVVIFSAYIAPSASFSSQKHTEIHEEAFSAPTNIAASPASPASPSLPSLRPSPAPTKLFHRIQHPSRHHSRLIIRDATSVNKLHTTTSALNTENKAVVQQIQLWSHASCPVVQRSIRMQRSNASESTVQAPHATQLHHHLH